MRSKRGFWPAVIVAVVVLIIGVLIFWNMSGDDGAVELEDEGTDIVVGDSGTLNAENIIQMTYKGYDPVDLEISVGDSVTFFIVDVDKHWPASDVHPTHSVYPDSDINKCGSNEADEIFDACRGLVQGESYSFTFNEVGTWEYHDHLKPSMKGSINVK